MDALHGFRYAVECRLRGACRLHDTIRGRRLADLCSDLVPKITCQVVEPGLISRLWLRTPC